MASPQGILRTLLVAAALAAPAAAQDDLYVVEVGALDLRPLDIPVAEQKIAHWSERSQLLPRVALEGPGEAWLRFPGLRAARGRWRDQVLTLAVRVPAGTRVQGRIFLPDDGWTHLQPFGFELAAAAAGAAQEAFDAVRSDHLQHLWRSGVPGAAWFRHLVGPLPDEPARGGLPSSAQRRTSEFERSFAMFTGGRALAENLQLDRELLLRGSAETGKLIDEMSGVTVRPFDFETTLAELGKPQLDPLAAWIPDDQHAVFFPSFGEMVAVADEIERRAAPLMRLVEPRGEHASTRRRYERQLCAELDGIARAFGPESVDAVALTGSDPYLRTGSDVALLFSCRVPEAVLADFHRRQDLAVARDGAVRADAEIDGVTIRVVRTPDRLRDSWVARSGSVVMVANSRVALANLLRTKAGARQALAAAPEYQFFRHRYPRGTAGESAFVMLTDATIRRWAGPRWRILASRRTRAAATLAEYQARAMPRIAARSTAGVQVEIDPALPDVDALVLEPGGVRSTKWGSLTFLTPIAELRADMATATEVRAYEQFRTQFQRQWNGTFDPIAAVIDVGADKLRVDLSVVPLTVGSDYRELADLTRGVLLEPGAGDAHADSLLHWSASVNRESGTYRDWAGLISGMGLGLTPLDWVGDDVSLYADADPFWDEYVAAEDRNEFIDANLGRMPVAVRVAARDPLRMAAFLAAMRAFVNGAAPGLVRWHNLEYKELGYVRLASDEVDWSIHYAALPDGWTLSFSEKVIQRAIDRWIARKEAASETEAGAPPAVTDALPPRESKGDHLRVYARPGVFPVLEALWSENLDRAMREASWANLTILNEWRRSFPDKDPVTLHERAWQTHLVCPGGGEYVWNADWLTYESTVYGHPGQPRRRQGLPAEFDGIKAGEFGLNFDGEGLRARVELDRR